MKIFFQGIERERVKIHGFYPEWAKSTYQIISFLIIAFSVVIAFPYYVPGSGSLAFKGVYTSGSPRVGNEVFKKNFEVKIYRIVNNDDIVPRVPLPIRYVHVGELKFIDSDGIIRNKIIKNEPPIDDFHDDPPGFENTNQRMKNTYKGFIPAPFRDHVPYLYAVHIWNNFVENQL